MMYSSRRMPAKGENESMRWAVLLIFGTIGLAALVAGTIWGLESYAVFRDNVSTRGTVVEEFADKAGKTSEVVYFPVVEFSTTGNGKVCFRSVIGSIGSPGYDTGTTVDVLYDPRNPSNARIGSFKQLWQGPLTTGGLGLILFLLSLLLFVKIGRFEKGLKAVGSGKKEKSL
jgi:hypothetical protein